MSLHRYAAKRDLAEADVRVTLERCGWTWQSVSIPHGPDALVGKLGRTELVQVKTGTRTETAGQVRWKTKWRGSRVWLIHTAEEALGFNKLLSAGLHAAGGRER